MSKSPTSLIQIRLTASLNHGTMSHARPDLVRKTSTDWVPDPGHLSPSWKEGQTKDAQAKAVAKLRSQQNHLQTHRPMREVGPRRDMVDDISFSLKDVLNISPSSFSLKEVLDRAPGLGWEGDENVDVVQHWPSGEKYVYWTNPYYAEVFNALIGVIREHGITGWKDARWTVHDTYHQSMGLVRMNESIYGSAWVEDDGRGWLQERIVVDREPPFAFNPDKSPPPVWKEYAAVLNILTRAA